MKKFTIFVIAIGIICAVAVLLDIFAKGMAERTISTGVKEGLDLEDPPEVKIEGFPFVLDLMSGILEEVTVSASGIGEGNVRFDDATLTLDNVRLDYDTMFSSELDSVQIGGGSGEVRMTGRSLTRTLNEQGAPITVRFRSGRVVVELEGVGEERGDIALDGSSLVVSSPSLPQSYSLGLPQIAEGVSYRSVTVEGNEAVLGLGLSSGDFKLPG